MVIQKITAKPNIFIVLTQIIVMPKLHIALLLKCVIYSKMKIAAFLLK